MSQDNAAQNTKGHLKIFAVLLVLTLVSAGATMAGASASLGMAVALGIACVQVVLVSLFLMHFWQEKKTVRLLFAFAAFFVAFLFIMEIAARRDKLEGSEFIAPVAQADQEDGESEH